MLGFGWVTQKAVRGSMKVNNILTNVIKAYLLENGCVRPEGEENTGKNCLYHPNKEQYIVIYTRNESGQNGDNTWAPYEYVKALSEGEKNIILLLGILEDNSIKGRLYVLENEEINDLLLNQKLNRGKHYSVSESLVLNEQSRRFEDSNKLHEILEKIMDSNGG